MENKWKTREVVVAAMIAAVIGVIFTVMDHLYMPLSSLLGPVFMELTAGIYILSAALPMYIVRKPGFAVFGGVVAAGVNLLTGSAYGIQVVIAGILQGIGLEIGYLIIQKYKGSIVNNVLGAAAAMLLTFGRDCIVFGYLELPKGTLIGILVVRILSAAILGTVLTTGIGTALKKTGVVRNFRCMQE